MSDSCRVHHTQRQPSFSSFFVLRFDAPSLVGCSDVPPTHRLDKGNSDSEPCGRSDAYSRNHMRADITERKSSQPTNQAASQSVSCSNQCDRHADPSNYNDKIIIMFDRRLPQRRRGGDDQVGLGSHRTVASPPHRQSQRSYVCMYVTTGMERRDAETYTLTKACIIMYIKQHGDDDTRREYVRSLCCLVCCSSCALLKSSTGSKAASPPRYFH